MTPKHNYFRRKPLFLALLILGALALLILILEFTNTTHLFHARAVPVTNNAYTKGESATSQTSDTASSGSSTNDSGSEPGDDKSNPGGENSNVALLAPSGDFVSNHHPNLGGSPAPNSLSSVCNTTPGASCVISFTKDGITKSLASQATDRGGAAYWNWTLQEAGLTVGSWKVTAMAALNGKTAASSDAMELVVAQ